MRRLFGLGGCAAAFAAWGLFSCSASVAPSAAEGDAGGAPGVLGHACYGNQTCNAGLTCVADVCLAAKGLDAGSTPGLDAGSTPGLDAGSTPGLDAGSTSGLDAGSPLTVYQKLGGHGGVVAAVASIFAALAADAQLYSYFAIRTGGVSGTPSPASPTFADVQDCFTQQLSQWVGGPERYTLLDGASPYMTAGGFACRDMTQAHAGLHVSAIAFQKFFSVTATVLASPPYSLTANDLSSLAAGMSADQSAIIDPTRDAGASTVYGARCSDIDGGQTLGGPAAVGCELGQ
jgi:hypothetical protein